MGLLLGAMESPVGEDSSVVRAATEGKGLRKDPREVSGAAPSPDSPPALVPSRCSGCL